MSTARQRHIGGHTQKEGVLVGGGHHDLLLSHLLGAAHQVRAHQRPPEEEPRERAGTEAGAVVRGRDTGRGLTAGVTIRVGAAPATVEVKREDIMAGMYMCWLPRLTDR